MSTKGTTGAASGQTPKPWILDFVLLSAMWGISFLFMRICAPEFGPFVTAWLRVFIGGCLLVPMMFARGLGGEFRKKWRATFLVGVFNSAIPFACFSYALLTIPSGLSAILNATVPLMGALVAWIWLKERPSMWRALGLAIGFLGVFMLAWSRTSVMHVAPVATVGGAAADFDFASALAVFLCMVATVSYGIAPVFARKYLAGCNPTMTAGGSLIGAMLLLAIPAAFTLPDHVPGAFAWLTALASGLICTGLAYIVYFRLIENAGAQKALAVTFMVPVFAVVTGVIFLKEDVTGWMIFCGLIILVGVVLSTGVWPRAKTVAGHLPPAG